MINTLSYQVYPSKSKWIANAFEDATSRPFGYLFLDLKPNVKHRVKTGVLSHEEYYVYVHGSEPNHLSVPNNTRSVCEGDVLSESGEEGP